MDVLATLRPVAVEVQLGDFIYELPALPAADWIAAMADPDGGAIIPGLLEPEDQWLVWRDFVRGRIDPDELAAAWREVLGVVTGRKWWIGARLVLNAVHPDVWPTIHGRLTKDGLDLEAVSIGAFCDVVWVMMLDGAQNEEERINARFQLTVPPPEVEIADAYDPAETAEGWMAAMAQMQDLGGNG